MIRFNDNWWLSWCQLWRKSVLRPNSSPLAASQVVMKTESWQDFVVPRCTVGCHNHNLPWFLQWRQSWCHDNYRFSMFMFIDLPDPIRHRRYGKHQKTNGHMKSPHFRERSEFTSKVQPRNYDTCPAHDLYICVLNQITKQYVSYAHSSDE